jgi:hypothetical protein
LKKELSKLLAALGANKTLPLIDTDDTDKKNQNLQPQRTSIRLADARSGQATEHGGGKTKLTTD